ncbi:tRNA pseudouridine synthase D [Anaerolineae bacterium]|nr:tRNA pseudouridine synthase D [Anaerolineae bacterium]
MSNLLFVYGSPSSSGKIRTLPEDFVVIEHLSFEPSGAGEHVFLFIEKIGENTEYVARQLAKFAGVKQRDVSYAGLKDRHAVTQQWFSVIVPIKTELDWTAFNTESIKVLQAVRHIRKLKRGALSGNQFKITVRDWQGDKEKTEQQLEAIKTNGIANYFGEQRFGHEGQNIAKAIAMFQGEKVGREQRSIYLSAARSELFNQMLARRVANQTWNQAVAGEYCVLNNSHSYFKVDVLTDELQERVSSHDIHPSAILWGKGNAELYEIEQAVIAENQVLADGLLAEGLEQDRRALRVSVSDLMWQFHDDSLILEFSLPAGSYATAFLREVIEL